MKNSQATRKVAATSPRGRLARSPGSRICRSQKSPRGRGAVAWARSPGRSRREVASTADRRAWRGRRDVAARSPIYHLFFYAFILSLPRHRCHDSITSPNLPPFTFTVNVRCHLYIKDPDKHQSLAMNKAVLHTHLLMDRTFTSLFCAYIQMQV